MSQRLLIITEREEDLELFRQILGPKGFDIRDISVSNQIQETIQEDTFEAILADYDLIGDRAHIWLRMLQRHRSRSCFILYGERIQPEKLSDILQRGVYAFVPRRLLTERIYHTILAGLENRKAFIKILGMIDELKDVNEKLKSEREALVAKNQELGFISRLSNEVAYDLDWDGIVSRIMDSGFAKVIDPVLLSLLYRIGSKWHLAMHFPAAVSHKGSIEDLKKDVLNRFFTLSGEGISLEDLTLHVHTPKEGKSLLSPASFQTQWTLPLRLAGKPLGILSVFPKNGEEFEEKKRELMSTVSNILAISLKNAQEYHRVKEMAVTDGMTGVFNYKGFQEFMKREFQRAKRYKKPLSLIMIDVDGFKAINDSLGHQAGDYVLRELASCLKGSVRNSDIVARYGGDEFVILLPETDLKEAEVLIRRMSSTIKDHPFQWKSKRINIEISYGISSVSELGNGRGENELIRRADSRLYSLKLSTIKAFMTQ